MVFFQSYVIMPGGRLRESENKRICRISDLKSGRGRLRNSSSGRLREFLKQYLTETENGYFQSGGLREVVVVRELTVESVIESMRARVNEDDTHPV